MTETPEQFGEAMARLEAWRLGDKAARHYTVRHWHCLFKDGTRKSRWSVELFPSYIASVVEALRAVTLTETVDAVLAKHAASGGAL